MMDAIEAQLDQLDEDELQIVRFLRAHPNLEPDTRRTMLRSLARMDEEWIRLSERRATARFRELGLGELARGPGARLDGDQAARLDGGRGQENPAGKVSASPGRFF